MPTRARGRPDRPRRPSRGRRHAGPHRRPGASRLLGRGCRQARRSTTPSKLAYVTQTTLSRRRHARHHRRAQAPLPGHQGPGRATTSATRRRTASRRCASSRGAVDILLVVGARNSSNSNRLREIGAEIDVPTYLIDDADGLDPAWLEGKKTVGVTAGASAPEELVRRAHRALAGVRLPERDEARTASRRTCVSSCRAEVRDLERASA